LILRENPAGIVVVDVDGVDVDGVDVIFVSRVTLLQPFLTFFHVVVNERPRLRI
jgi:hypothetical protein